MFQSTNRIAVDATTGFGLKVRRQALGVQACTVAEFMGVSRARVAAIEASRFPTRAARERYIEALGRAAAGR
jgi:transcriptional regulator with XRE-family HTH domain